MGIKNKISQNMGENASESAGSPERREFIRRLAKSSIVLPTAAVIYSSSTTVAAATP